MRPLRAITLGALLSLGGDLGCDGGSSQGGAGGASTASTTGSHPTSNASSSSGASCAPMSCDDNVACTTDSCKADGSCVHLVNDAACPTGQYCDIVKGCTPPPVCATDADCVEAWKTDPCKSMPKCDHATSHCTFALLDSDGDGHASATCGGDDCDDSKPIVHPQPANFHGDLCDGLDEDCDGLVDEDYNDPSLFSQACGALKQCVGGACVCKPENDCGGGFCADLTSDPDNCGNCTAHCGPNQMCSSSTCVCPAPFTECSDGSCTMLDTSAHCGSCSNVCGAMESCVSQMCIPSMTMATTGASMSTGTSMGNVCGDGVVGPAEQCDDGNTASGDGCSDVCGIESDSNGSFATATPLPFGQTVQATLDPVETDVDYYVFTGQAGMVLSAVTDAKPNVDPFAPGYPDTVLTLFDETFTQIAENDDTVPHVTNDSEILTILPATGTYYLRVTEYCNTYPPGNLCTPPAPITSTQYAIRITALDGALNSLVPEVEPNDSTATATPWEFQKVNSNPNVYGASIGWGVWSSSSDTDVFRITVPSDLTVPAGRRADLTLTFLPIGPSGSGATAKSDLVMFGVSVGMNLAILDPNAFMTDDAGVTLRAPVTPGTTYYFWMHKESGPSLPQDFYFIKESYAPGNPIETLPDDNNTVATADALTLSGSNQYFIEGDLPTTSDVDIYSMSAPSGTSKVSVSCASTANGAGTQNFTVELLDQTGVSMPGGSATEVDASQTAALTNFSIGANSTIYARLTKGSQFDPVTGTFYTCGFTFGP